MGKHHTNEARTVTMEGDGKQHRAYAKKHQARVTVRRGGLGQGGPDGAGLELIVDRDGEWELRKLEPRSYHGHGLAIASGKIEDPYPE